MPEVSADSGSEAARRGGSLWRAVGPGICMAGAAIGVSHLMQSTRAGADFGYQLLLLVVLVNIFKYPFFEFGARYAAATGESLLHGYLKMGRFFLASYLVLNVVLCIGTIAGVGFLTAALAENLFQLGLSLAQWTSIIMIVCAAIVVIGHYRALENFLKVLVGLLTITTVIAFIAVLGQPAAGDPSFVAPSAWTLSALPFLIALMGWMPAPIEVSVWQSLWVGANDKARGSRSSWRQARFDYNLGFVLMIVTAVMFVVLGARVMHGTGTEFAQSNAAFADQLMRLYTSTLGEWTRPVIAVAALCAMFSTTLTVIDAYPRSLGVGMKLLFPQMRLSDRAAQAIWVAIGCLGAAGIVFFLFSSLTALIDWVTVIAFLGGPYFAWMNLRLVRSPLMPEAFRPGKFLTILSLIGFFYFLGFAVIYLLLRGGLLN